MLHDWKWIVRRAWSVRFMALAGILSGVEVALSLTTPGFLGLPPGGFAALSGVATAVAFIARLVAQRR